MNKRQVASFLKRAPWTGYLAQALYRIWQPRVTIGVVGAVFNHTGQMLIVEHVFHPKFPWGLPGGWMVRDEEPSHTVIREVLEETALHVNIVKPLAIARTKFLPQHLDVAFLCVLPPDADQDAVKLSSELLAYQWIDLAQYPTQTPPMANFHNRVVESVLVERSRIID
ncbi:MAG: NUDIX domain-containing protein [Chloroflexota bacterium]